MTSSVAVMLAEKAAAAKPPSPRAAAQLGGLCMETAFSQSSGFASPAELLGEVVGVACVVKQGATPPTIDQLRQGVKSVGNRFKPSVLVYMEAIPKGPTGKPKRIGLAKQLGIPSERRRGRGLEHRRAARARPGDAVRGDLGHGRDDRRHELAPVVPREARRRRQVPLDAEALLEHALLEGVLRRLAPRELLRRERLLGAPGPHVALAQGRLAPPQLLGERGLDHVTVLQRRHGRVARERRV